MSDLFHVLVVVREVRQLHVTTTGAPDYGVSPSSPQEHRLVGDDRCPAPLPAAIAAAAAAAAATVGVVVVVAVAVAVVAHALRARPYVYARDCAHDHVQTEVPRR